MLSYAIEPSVKSCAGKGLPFVSGVNQINTTPIPTAPRFVDQHALLPEHWFHPRMGGRTLIKVAPPAALAVAKSIRIDNWHRDVRLLEPQSGARPDNPYSLFPSLDVPGLGTEDEENDPGTSVTDGVEAMRASQDMVYGRYMSTPGASFSDL